MEMIKEKIERWKLKADMFLKNNIKAFIVDTSDNYYFCTIDKLGDLYLFVNSFAGQRKGNRDRIMWIDILRFDEYKKDNHKGDGEHAKH